MFTNYYGQFGNPYFEADGRVWDRDLMAADAAGYLPDDLVALPEPTWDRFPDDQPLSADEARTLLWLFAGDIGRAARYYRMPPKRLGTFVRHSSRMLQSFTRRASAFSIWPKRSYSKRCSLTIPSGAIPQLVIFSPNRRRAERGFTL
jgi:hypothetical protein